jgi:hypothetical protein
MHNRMHKIIKTFTLGFFTTLQNPLKTDFFLFSFYRTEKTSRLHYTDLSVNAIEGYVRKIFSGP